MNLKVNLLLDTFNATIPAQQYGTMVQYRIYANDTDGIWAVSGTYSYTVIDNVHSDPYSVCLFRV